MSDYTQFEFLPSEVFFEIFDYLSLTDLDQSFKNLNQRINYILRSLNNRAVRLWSTSDNREHEMNKFFFVDDCFLVINDEYNLDLNQHPKIRSLTYMYATDDQLQHFLLSTFCHQNLKYLNVTSDDLSALVEFLFSHRFPSLHHCILHNIDSLATCPWRITPTPRSISICSDANLVPFILQSCPNLKRLALFISQYSNASSSLLVFHPHLQYLSIEMTEPAWTVEILQTLFSSIQVPHLISFRIRSYESSAVPFDFVQLADIFKGQIPNLKRFECDILVSNNVGMMDCKSIRDLHPFLFLPLKFQYQSNGSLRISTSPSAN